MRLFIFVLMLISVITSCYQKKPNESGYQPSFSEESNQVVKNNDIIYSFGVHPLHNPQRLFKTFNPLLRYLSKNIQGVGFKLETSKNYASYDKKLALKVFEFALPNPYQTVLAIDNGYNVFAKMADDESFKGIILIRKDSAITEIQDLLGKAISYPAPTALAATMMPQYFLQQNGINILKDIDNHYVGSQESSIMNVFVGTTVAASTWPPPWLALIKERPELAEQLIVKWQTPHLINNGLIARKDVPAKIIDEVRGLLISLHKTTEGREIIQKMELSSFETADNGSYDIVRSFLHDFNEKVRPIK